MPLTGLPYEVLSIITEYLDLEDVFHLGLTSPSLLHLIQDNRSCRGVLEVSPSFFSHISLRQLHKHLFLPRHNLHPRLHLPATLAVRRRRRKSRTHRTHHYHHHQGIS